MVTIHDTSLTTIEWALDPEEMTGHLIPLLPFSACITAARLHDFKPGQRCLVQYAVTDRKSGARYTIFSKLYADPIRGGRVYQTMKSLDMTFASIPGLRVPRPLGWIPELAMLVYMPADGQSLDKTLASGRGTDDLGRAGEWLAALHRQRLTLDKQFQLERELADVQTWATLVGETFPDQARTATQITDCLRVSAETLPFTVDVPIHKDFHYGHVIVNDQDGLAVIDFDEARLGDPNLDLAHFSANLYLLALRQNRLPEFLSFERRFLDSYARTTGWTADGRFTFFFGYTAIKIAKQLCLHRGPLPRPEGERRQDQVRLILSQGCTALGIKSYDRA